MNFDLFTIWAVEATNPEAPWLVDAWDEYSIDDNGRGWDEAVAKARASSHDIRIIRVRVSHDLILRAFESPIIDGEVSA